MATEESSSSEPFYKPQVPADQVFKPHSVKVPTKPHKMDKDHEPPSLGLLDANNMPNATALASMEPGIDQTLVHGEQTIRIEGPRSILILKDETREIVEKQDQVVHGETTLVYEHGRNTVVGDQDELTVNGYQEIFVTGESEETYLGTHEVNAPMEFEKKWLEAGATGAELKFLGIGASVIGREQEIKMYDEKEGMYQMVMKGFHEQAVGQKGEAKVMGNKVGTHADANIKVNPAPEVGTTHIP